MPTSTSSLTNPFDPISGDLLPAYREAYVEGHLSPDLAQLVEDYLKSSPIQTNIVLGRAHALAAAAQAEARPFAPPAWVQEQLRSQPTVSAVGPLRRPAVRLALGLFLALVLASVVQWLRNEPLLPAPVAKAVARAASSATQATQRLVQQFTAPAAAPPAPARAVAAKAPAARPQPSRPVVQALALAKPVRVALVVPETADSLTVPRSLPVAATGPASLVHGRITDAQGHPLPGATVLVQGTHQITSANAVGDYQLTAPAGATLEFGYGGYADQQLRNPGAGDVNVILQPDATGRHRARERR